MNIPTLIRRLTLPAAALLVITACASGQSAGWTYAPLGPTANPSAAASGAPATPAGSGSAGGITIETPADQMLAFVPAEITVAPGSQVTVTYVNNSTLLHNINFFNGPDNSAPSLGSTPQGTGPNDSQTVIFTAPSQPGDYFFWCDVHQSAMKGVWHVK